MSHREGRDLSHQEDGGFGHSFKGSKLDFEPLRTKGVSPKGHRESLRRVRSVIPQEGGLRDTYRKGGNTRIPPLRHYQSHPRRRFKFIKQEKFSTNGLGLELKGVPLRECLT